MHVMLVLQIVLVVISMLMDLQLVLIIMMDIYFLKISRQKDLVMELVPTE